MGCWRVKQYIMNEKWHHTQWSCRSCTIHVSLPIKRLQSGSHVNYCSVFLCTSKRHRPGLMKLFDVKLRWDASDLRERGSAGQRLINTNIKSLCYHLFFRRPAVFRTYRYFKFDLICCSDFTAACILMFKWLKAASLSPSILASVCNKERVCSLCSGLRTCVQLFEWCTVHYSDIWHSRKNTTTLTLCPVCADKWCNPVFLSTNQQCTFHSFRWV